MQIRTGGLIWKKRHTCEKMEIHIAIVRLQPAARQLFSFPQKERLRFLPAFK